MSKKRMVFIYASGFIIGLFIIPSILNWLGLPSPIASILFFVFGEPTPLKIVIVSFICILIIYPIVRSFYKQYKKAS